MSCRYNARYIGVYTFILGKFIGSCTIREWLRVYIKQLNHTKKNNSNDVTEIIDIVRTHELCSNKNNTSRPI